MSWGSWLFSAHRNRENSSPPSPPGGSAAVMQEPWIWVWKTKMCEKSWIFVQIGPDQNYIKSLLLSLLQCLVGACFQEGWWGDARSRVRCWRGLSQAPQRSESHPGALCWQLHSGSLLQAVLYALHHRLVKMLLHLLPFPPPLSLLMTFP